jgi:hypothetical protein
MIWILVIAGTALAFVIAVCCAALVEVFKNLEDIRVVLNLSDEPTPMVLSTAALRASDVGLPGELDREPEVIVVFLSSKCGTCRSIAEAFRGGAPATVWFVLSGASASAQLTDLLSESFDRLIHDPDDAIADGLGLNVTPSVVTTSFGAITRAQAVSSARQVLRMIPVVLSTSMTPAE